MRAPRLRGFHHARPAVTAVGLERRTTTNQSAFHRFDPDLAARAGSTTLVVHVHGLAPNPVACHAPSCLVKGGGPASSYPLASVSRYPVTRGPRRLATRRRREGCVSPTSATDFTSRAPCGLLDSRLRARMPRGSSTPARPGPKAERYQGWDLDAACRTNQPGGASLDGEPPASASTATRYMGPSRPPLGASGVEAPEAHVLQTRRSPGGAAIDSPSAPSLPVRAFSAADRACDEASDALFCDPGGSGLTIAHEWIPVTRDRSIRRRSRLVKGRPRRRIRTPSIDESPSFAAPCACAHDGRNHREPAGLAARVLVAFATAIRLQRCFTGGASPKGEPAS